MKTAFTRIAVADLDRIWIDCAERSGLDAADSVVSRIHTVLATTIATFPMSGRIRPELGSGVRSFPVLPYVLFYEIRSRRVRVLRVLHGHRDIREPLMSLLAAV